MRREELKHLIPCRGRVTGEQHVIVMGSQAILGRRKEIASAQCLTRLLWSVPASNRYGREQRTTSDRCMGLASPLAHLPHV
jgi:hypothetical protein